jgi:hypothetical protein
MFPYSAGLDYDIYVRTTPPQINAQAGQALMDNFPITGIQADHSSQAQDFTWHGGLHQGFATVGSYTMPNQSYTNGGMPPLHGFETQFVSSSQPSVPYPGPDYWPINSGYQHHVPAGPSTQYNSALTMFPHPMASQTPTPLDAAADVHSSFAPATLNPTAETNSPPVVQGMFGATGQGLVLDATSPSIHPNPTAMPLPAPTSGTATPTSPLSDSESTPNTISPPVVRCMVDNCGKDIAVSKDALHQHLTATHNYPAPHRSRSVVCRWSGCLCTRPSTCRSLNLGTGHGVHIEDITEHVWTAHLNFQDICQKCGDARWVHGFSLQRHMNGCGGRKQARCKWCHQIFRSTVALAGHVELGLCEAAPDG